MLVVVAGTGRTVVLVCCFFVVLIG